MNGTHEKMTESIKNAYSLSESEIMASLIMNIKVDGVSNTNANTKVEHKSNAIEKVERAISFHKMVEDFGKEEKEDEPQIQKNYTT